MVRDGRHFDRREMEMVHTMFRREFGHLPRLIREATNAERAGIIAGHVALISGALHHHHCTEDHLVWPLLKNRVGNSLGKHLQLMESQHAELAIRLGQLSVGIRKWSTHDAALNRPGPDASRLAILLDEHLATEEKLVVPVMEQHITAAEWDAMVCAGTAAVDPAMLPLAFGMLMYEGDFDVVEHALGNFPAAARPELCSRATDAYSRHASRVYGTPSPPRSTEI